MFKKGLLVLLFIVSISNFALAKELSDNPGYFKSPFFIALGGSDVYFNGKTSSVHDIRPILLGMINVVQTEYGNLGLSIATMPLAPYRNYNNKDFSYRLASDIFTAEFGLNYITGSKSFNFWLGAGYNYTFIRSKIKKVRGNDGSDSSFSKTFTKNVSGWHYYVGMQIFPVETSNWALFFILRGQETNRAKYDIDSDITFSNGNVFNYKDHLEKDFSNRSYTIGISYSF